MRERISWYEWAIALDVRWAVLVLFAILLAILLAVPVINEIHPSPGYEAWKATQRWAYKRKWERAKTNVSEFIESMGVTW